MLKKISVALSLIFVMALLCQTALAAVIEVDTASKEFTVESYQNNATSGEICPLANAFGTTSTTTATGLTNADIKRFSASLNVNEANITGEPKFTVIDGRATLNPVFPFKTEMVLEKFSLRFNNATRQYFLNAYVSMDGKTWTAVELGGAAKKVTLENGVDPVTAAYTAKGLECYATTPAGTADSKDINIITITLVKPVSAKYLKLTWYGNDNAAGALKVAHSWISFNNLKLEGTAPVVATTAATTKAPATTTKATSTGAAKTGDSTIVVLFAFAALSAAVAFMAKRRIASK